MTQKKAKKKSLLTVNKITNDCLRIIREMNKKPIKILSDIILARRLPDEEKTKYGIILLPSKRLDEYERKGLRIFEVLEHGPGRIDKKGKFHPISIKKGERFVLDNFTTVEHDYMGQDCIFTRESEILAVLE